MTETATDLAILTGRAVDVWEEDKDGVGDPYWTALLAQSAVDDGHAAINATLAQLPLDGRPGHTVAGEARPALQPHQLNA